MSESGDLVCRSLTLVDSQGRPAIWLNASSDGHPVVMMFGKGRSGLVMSAEGATVRMEFRREGGLPAMVVVTSEESTNVVTYEKQGHHVAALRSYESGGEIRLRAEEPGGEQRVVSF